MNNAKKKLIYCGLTLGVLETVNICISENSKKLEHKYRDKNTDNYMWVKCNVRYTVKGEGKPILLIHNLVPDSNSYDWSKVLPILEGTRKVYCVDLPGCGYSGKTNVLYTNASYMQFIVDFISDIIGEKTDIACIGNSVTPVLSACANSGSLIDNVFLVNPSPLEDIIGEKRISNIINMCVLNIPIVGSFLYNVAYSKAYTKFKMQNFYFNNSGSIRHDDIDRFYCMAHRNHDSGKRLYSALAGKFLNCESEEVFSRMENNVYLLIGRNTLYAKDIVKKYSKLFPNIKTVVIKNTKLMLPLENHLATANAILNV